MMAALQQNLRPTQGEGLLDLREGLRQRGHLHNQDCVLRGKADQHDHPDLRVHVVLVIPQIQRHEAAEDRLLAAHGFAGVAVKADPGAPEWPDQRVGNGGSSGRQR